MESDPTISSAGYGCRPFQSGHLSDPIFCTPRLLMEVPSCYPGLECEQKIIINLISTLTQPDAAEPWFTQYRSSIANHPGSPIPRMPGKCFTAYLLGFGLRSFMIPYNFPRSFFVFFSLKLSSSLRLFIRYRTLTIRYRHTLHICPHFYHLVQPPCTYTYPPSHKTSLYIRPSTISYTPPSIRQPLVTSTVG